MSTNKDMPKMIKSYKIEKETYKLSSSILYTATNTDLNEKVLIDAFRKERIKSKVDEVTFLNNGIFISKLLNHKNILKLYEIIETPTYVFQVYEYFNGVKLSDYISKKKKLSEDEALTILKEVVSALVYLHDMNLCHLNLNSNDIIVDDKKNIKIYDFNFSHFYSSKNKSKAGLIGDHEFTCPELHSKKMYSEELADMWSVGVLLYHMLVGKVPFDSKKDLDVIRLIIRGEYTVPNSVNAKYQELIKGLMEVKDDKRMKLDDLFNNAIFKDKKITKDSLFRGLNIFETKYPIDPVALDVCKNNLGLDANAITKALENNQFSPLTSVFKQVVGKFVSKGIQSISDLTSAKFIAYVNDAKNCLKNDEQRKNLQKYLKKEEEVKKGTKDLAAILFNNQNEISTRLGDINRHYENIKKGYKPKIKVPSSDNVKFKRNYKLVDSSDESDSEGGDDIKQEGKNKRKTVCYPDMSNFQFPGSGNNNNNKAGAKTNNIAVINNKNEPKKPLAKIEAIKEEEEPPTKVTQKPPEKPAPAKPQPKPMPQMPKKVEEKKPVQPTLKPPVKVEEKKPVETHKVEPPIKPPVKVEEKKPPETHKVQPALKPPVKVEEKKPVETHKAQPALKPPVKVEEKKPVETHKAEPANKPPVKVEEKKPVETHKPPVKVEEKKPAEAPKPAAGGSNPFLAMIANQKNKAKPPSAAPKEEPKKAAPATTPAANTGSQPAGFNMKGLKSIFEANSKAKK